SLAHCTLAAGRTSKAVQHRTVEAVWYVLSGAGVLWRAVEDLEEELSLRPGIAVTIPGGTRFQFRNPGADALTILLVTTPPWPGEDEAIRVADHWPPSR
ncbi:MAG: cupin domain-containing protein, partial [Proteobacteria bacterium]|nr:cupin domain-containing protein [Pseudomonadota bacterium]